MEIILFILTLGTTEPQVADVNAVYTFPGLPGKMEACKQEAADLNKKFKETGAEFVAGCGILDDNFVKGARMGAYSTIKKYEYCLTVATSFKDMTLKQQFDECTRIISEDVDAIWPKGIRLMWSFLNKPSDETIDADRLTAEIEKAGSTVNWINANKNKLGRLTIYAWMTLQTLQLQELNESVKNNAK